MERTDKGLIVIEDEPVIASMIEDIAHDIGWLVIGSAHTETDAFKLLDQCEPRLAILDVNLGLADSLAVAASCRDRGIAVVFVTGYTARDLPRQCADAPILAKPFSFDQLERSIERALQPEPMVA